MPKLNKKFPTIKRVYWPLIGILLLLVLAVGFLWYGNTNSYQAVNAIAAQVYFEGEYQVAEGPWQPIKEGEHIPSTMGDVTLRGNFHMLTPDGEYVGIYRGEIPIAFYLDHINLTTQEGDSEPFIHDPENPVFKDAACGAQWAAVTFLGESDETIEMVIHNPHRYGNETAIDTMLSNISLWTGIDFEKQALKAGDAQRNTGLFFMIVSLALLGIALFSSLIHIKNSKLLWLFGLVIFFAGSYFIYSADGIYFWNDSIVSNTILLGSSMLFYMLFLSVLIVCFLDTTKKAGIVIVTCLGVADAIAFLLALTTDLLFYDTWPYWTLAQSAANLALMGCLVKECFVAKKENIWIYLSAIFPLLAFGVDAGITAYGIWKGGEVSKYVFLLLFAITMVVVLRIIPQGINAATKAKELETEKAALNAQLAQSRISTMMSQIRPHFIYNTLGSIEQLCQFDPQKAGELVHNFAKYLRGNFGELDNPKPILMSQEMAHVHHYISIENVRFPDMTFSFEMNSGDFHIPALTIQPIVENAIKHGLMKLPKGGTIRVVSYETATHYCVSVVDDGLGFDTSELLDDRKHVGIRNIRERLKAMVKGTLEIESTVGVGTKVLITIPKEVEA